MRMALASEKDMAAMLLLNAMLGDIDEGAYPRGLDGEFDADEPDCFDEDDDKHCRAFVRRVLEVMCKHPGASNRVVWGFSTVLHNDVFDRTQESLEWHPTLKAAVAARAPKEEAKEGRADG